MAWVKLDDAMPHHPKVMAAGPQAFALDVAGICYSNKHATDGFIPAASLAAVYPALSNPKKWAAVLVEVGRWHVVDGGWRIHDVDDYQPTAADQKELSKKRAEAGRRGGLRSAKSKQVAKQSVEAKSNPDPTRPDDEASSSFASFHAKRAADAVRERKRRGLAVKSEGGLARTIQQDPEFVAESRRLWEHRDCPDCKGEGVTLAYSPGAGTREIPCEGGEK